MIMFLLEETPIIPSAELNRGVWLDSNLSMSTHFNRDSGARLVHNLSSSVIKKIQRVQNMAARLIYCRSKFLSHHPLELHRLSVTYRIQCKILVITYKVPHGMVPGARFSKFPKAFQARKAIRKTPTRKF